MNAHRITTTGRDGGERDLCAAERFALRIDMALRYGDRTNGSYPVTLRNRWTARIKSSVIATRVVETRSVRGYEDLTIMVPVDLYCCECGCNLQIADSSDRETYAELDRIIPGSKGGKYRKGNVRPCCRVCNARRGDADLPS